MISRQQLPGVAGAVGTTFLLYAGLSIAWSSGDKLWSATQLALLVGAYAVGCCANIKLIWFGFLAYVGLSTALQLTGYFDYGLFGGPNYFGAAMAVAVAVALAWRCWWLVPLAFCGLWYSHSRGAILAGGVALLVAAWGYSKAGAIAILALSILAAALVTKSTLTPDTVDTIAARLGIWQDTINHLSFFGHGFGSFSTEYASWPRHTNMTGVFASHAYNDFLELNFELGIGAVLLWTFLAFSLERGSANDWLICLTFFTLSLTFSPLYMPIVGHLFACTIGHLNRRLPNGSLALSCPALPQHSRYGLGV